MSTIPRPEFISYIQNKVGDKSEDIEKGIITLPTDKDDAIEHNLASVVAEATRITEQADVFERSVPADQQDSFSAQLGLGVLKLRTKDLETNGGSAYSLLQGIFQAAPQQLGRTIAPKNFEVAPDPNARRGGGNGNSGIFSVELQDRNDETPGQYNNMRVGVLFVDTTPGVDGSFMYIHKDPPAPTTEPVTK